MATELSVGERIVQLFWHLGITRAHVGTSRLFGEDGFDNAVEQVAAIGKQLGMYDLPRFTPR